MGEVGGVVPEKPTENSATVTTTPSTTATVNGEVNGMRKLTTIDPSLNQPMDVDTEEDSQVSSENGISDPSENHSVLSKTTTPVAVLKAKPIIEGPSLGATPTAVNHNMPAKALSVHSEDNSLQDLEEEEEEEEEASRDHQSNNDVETEADNSQGDENTRTTSTTNDDNSQDVAEDDGKEDLSSRDNDQTMTTEGEEEETTNDNSTQNNLLEEENSQSSGQSGKSDLKENGLQLSNKEKAESNINSVVPSSGKITLMEESKAKENGVNGPKVSLNESDDITIIESDDDDNLPPPPKVSQAVVSKADSSMTSSNPKQIAESMEVDSTVNNGMKSSGILIVNPPNSMDDDAPVIIPSDSESEEDNTPPKRDIASEASKPSQAEEDMSGDDCVVIEDDDKKEKEPEVDERTANRHRKSIVRPRDIDEDDDITEIMDDLPPSKKPRTNIPIVAPATSPNPQIGQITIKDARSLMPQFPDTAKSFQQQFAQSVGIVAQTTGKPVPGAIPMATSPQQIFPNNIRPALAPLSAPPKLVPTAPVAITPTLPVSNPTLLPALTDDMFVLEAPSFIVPYIYEKPPAESLRDVVTKIEAEIQKIKTAIKESSSEDKKVEGNAEPKPEKPSGERGKEEKKGEEGTKSKKKKKSKNPDDSWDELDTSTDEEASDSELRTKVLIKDAKPTLDTINAVLTPDAAKPLPVTPAAAEEKKNDPKNENYFEGPLGKFFIDIGINLVQEYVQTDLLKIQKRKLSKSTKSATAETELAIRNLQKNIEASKKRNETFKFDMKRCEFCNFKTESALAMAHHYEMPHMRQYLYKCNLCPYETRPAHDILFHMEAVHNIKGRLEKALAYNQCPNCPFEENGKAKFARHVPVCAKKFKPEVNLQPPHDWEAPAKIPRIKPRHGLVGTATAYQAMAAQAAAQKAQLAAMAARATVTPVNPPPPKNRGGRPPTVPRMPSNNVSGMRANAPMRQPMPGVVLPSGYQIAPGGQIIQVAGSNLAVLPNPHNALNLQQPPQQQTQQNLKKNAGQQPSISITPLPRQPGNSSNSSALSAAAAAAMIQKPPGATAGMKPGQAPSGAGGKASFVICEICDGYIKDLEQLRNHMQWMHKVKIHPKMIHNRPPLNCQKCQFRFFTDQGLERHLLGSHGLVTSSMQEAANRGKDAGRCPVCGRMYQWKLLNHVSRDHSMTLKPAHLSYKCTVCTATFGMYKQFENHVYTAHSTVAKKAMDGKKSSSSNNNNSQLAGGSNSQLSGMSGITVSTIGGSSKLGNNSCLSAISSGDSLLKPLKINDEITIIPQPASKLRTSLPNDFDSHLMGKSSGKR